MRPIILLISVACILFLVSVSCASTDVEFVFIDKWGSLGSSPGQFNEPYGVAYDPVGLIYVADTNNHRIQKFSDAGDYVTSYGSEGTGLTQLITPHHLVVNSTGYLFISDLGNNRIVIYDSSGNYVHSWSSLGDGKGQFDRPYGIAIDNSDNIYVSDYGNHRVIKFSLTNNYQTAWIYPNDGSNPLLYPGGLIVNQDGKVFVCDIHHSRIVILSSDGSYYSSWENKGFNWPCNIAVTSYGNFIVTDTYNHRLVILSPDGTIINSCGSVGSGDLQFNRPDGLAIGDDGVVYVAEISNNRIHKIRLDLVFSNSGGGRWSSYKDVTVTEVSGESLTDYQVALDLDPTNFDFSQANPDGSDIRIADSSGNELPYWIEYWDSSTSSAKVWAKLPSIQASGSINIRLYYGNPTATSSSDGDATFILYDHFDGTSFDTSKWAMMSGGSYSWIWPQLSGSNLISSSQLNGIKSHTAFSNQKSVRFKSRFTGDWINWAGFGDYKPPYVMIHKYHAFSWWGATSADDDYEYTPLSPTYFNDAHVYDVSWVPGKAIYSVDDAVFATHVNEIPTASRNVNIVGTPETDWVFVRNFVEDEPIVIIGESSQLSNSGGGTWAYHDDITVTENSGTALIDYQIKVKLTSANFDFSKAKVDGSDIRFTDNSGNELPYWIEDFNSASQIGTIWVKIPILPQNGIITIKIYYGNNLASSSSYGNAVFEFFDDFNSGTIDPSLWTTQQNPIIVDGKLIVERSSGVNYDYRQNSIYDEYVKSIKRFGNGYALKTRAKFYSHSGWEATFLGFLDSGSSTPHAVVQSFYQDVPNPTSVYAHTNPPNNIYSMSGYTDIFHIYEIARIPGSVLYQFDSNSVISHHFDSSDELPVKAQAEFVDGARVDIDWIFVRNFVEDEPTVILTPSVIPGNHPPVLHPIGDRQVTIGEDLRIELSATDIDGDTLTYAFISPELSSKIIFDFEKGIFRFTPLDSDEGSYKITFYVSDNKGGSDYEDININVFPEHSKIVFYDWSATNDNEAYITLIFHPLMIHEGDVQNITIKDYYCQLVTDDGVFFNYIIPSRKKDDFQDQKTLAVKLSAVLADTLLGSAIGSPIPIPIGSFLVTYFYTPDEPAIDIVNGEISVLKYSKWDVDKSSPYYEFIIKLNSTQNREVWHITYDSSMKYEFDENEETFGAIADIPFRQYGAIVIMPDQVYHSYHSNDDNKAFFYQNYQISDIIETHKIVNSPDTNIKVLDYAAGSKSVYIELEYLDSIFHTNETYKDYTRIRSSNLNFSVPQDYRIVYLGPVGWKYDTNKIHATFGGKWSYFAFKQMIGAAASAHFDFSSSIFFTLFDYIWALASPIEFSDTVSVENFATYDQLFGHSNEEISYRFIYLISSEKNKEIWYTDYICYVNSTWNYNNPSPATGSWFRNSRPKDDYQESGSISIDTNGITINNVRIIKEDPKITFYKAGFLKCPAHLHAYDSLGRHIGLNQNGTIDTEIPGGYYQTNINNYESIIIYNPDDSIRFIIDSYDTGSFNFTYVNSTEHGQEIVTFKNIPIIPESKAEYNSSELNEHQAIHIDNNGDEVFDDCVFPLKVEYFSFSLMVDYLSNTTPGPAPLSVQFNDTSIGEEIIGYQWIFSDNPNEIYTERNLTKVFTSPGYYDVNHSVSNPFETVWKNETAYIHVTTPGLTQSFPNPLGGLFPQPTDPDQDGLYEDLDGNGWIGFNDVVIYYNNLDDIDSGVFGPVNLFDYDGSTFAGFNDVVRLYGMIV